MIGYLRFHRGRNAQRLVNPAEVVEGVPERHGGPVVFPFLAESVRQPSEPARTHADG